MLATRCQQWLLEFIICIQMFVKILSRWDYRSLEIEWRLYQGGRVDAFSQWRRGRKIITSVFGISSNIQGQGRSTNHFHFHQPDWNFDCCMKWCVFKMGTVAWNHPSILFRFNSYLLTIPGLITFTFKALLTAQFAPLSSSYWWWMLFLCSA